MKITISTSPVQRHVITEEEQFSIDLSKTIKSNHLNQKKPDLKEQVVSLAQEFCQANV